VKEAATGEVKTKGERRPREEKTKGEEEIA